MGGSVGKIPLIGKYLENSQEDAMKELRKNEALLKGLDPEQLKYQQQFTQINPEDYQGTQISENPALKQQYADYLTKLSGLSTSGLTDEDKYGYYTSGAEAGSDAASRTASIIDNARARGVSGGGTELALREMANQSASQRQQENNMAQAAKAAQQRALYTKAYGEGVDTSRRADLDVSSRNAEIMNKYNQMNTQQRNENMLRNAEGPNAVRQQNYRNMQDYVGGLTGQNEAIAGAHIRQGEHDRAVRGEGKDDAQMIATMGAGGFGKSNKKKG